MNSIVNGKGIRLLRQMVFLAAAVTSALGADVVESARNYASGDWQDERIWSTSPDIPGIDDNDLRVDIVGASEIRIDKQTPAIKIRSGKTTGEASLIVGHDYTGGARLVVDGGQVEGTELLKVGNLGDASLRMEGGTMRFDRLTLGNGVEGTNGTFLMEGGSAEFAVNAKLLNDSLLEFRGGQLRFGGSLLPGTGTLRVAGIGGFPYPIRFGGNLNPGAIRLELSLDDEARRQLRPGDALVLIEYGGILVSDFLDAAGKPIRDGDRLEIEGTAFTMEYVDSAPGGRRSISLRALRE